jgi:Ca-activated chloride channel family protein
MPKLLRTKLAAVVLALTCIAAAQDGVSTAGAARAKYLGNLGVIPAAKEIVVEDFVNYHRHEIARPKAGVAVALDLRWGSEAISKGHDAILQIGLSTALTHDREHLRPLNLTFVIDKSGSMADANKLVRVKQALLTLLPKLRSTDILSIVAFDSSAEVLLPAEKVGNGDQAREVIQSIEPGSSTNLNDGLMLGYKEDLKNYSKDATNRVILLTDGIANEGETDPDSIAQNSLGYNDRGIDLSTIGVGESLNTDLLQHLAKSGRGLSHFVADNDDIQKVFENEVQSLLSPVASEPNLEINLGPDYRLEQIYGYAPTTNGETTRIKLDNMNSGMTEVVLLRLKRTHLSGAQPIKVRLSYFDIDRDKEVVAIQSATVPTAERMPSDMLQDESIAKNYTIATLAQGMHDMAADCEKQHYIQAERDLEPSVSDARERYPSNDDPDIKRTLDTARQYQAILQERNGGRDADCPTRIHGHAHKGSNLIPNGDFARGNWGFTSGLGYVPAADNALWGHGYTVAPSFTNPYLHHLIPALEYAAPKNENGNEEVLFANAGGSQVLNVWSAKVKCKSHTRYRISFHSISLSSGVEWVPTYEIRVNSFRSDPQSSSEGTYNTIRTEWDSGNATSATITIARMPIPHGGGLIGIANIEMVEQ